MNKIPATSTSTPFGGIWFIFKDGDREIAAHNSIFAKERVFINQQIISDKRSLNRIGNHKFTFAENEYEIVFTVSKVLKGEIECWLLKDEICIEKIKAFYKQDHSKISRIERIMIGFLTGIFVFSFATIFKMPPLFIVITVMCIYLLMLGIVGSKSIKCIFEKIDL